MQFNIKEQAMSRQIDMQRRSGHAQKDSNDCPNHLFRVDRDSQGQLSIRLAHPKGDHQVEPYSKIAQPVKARICKVLEFLGIFHGLAVSHGVNKMLGTTANLQGLVKWYLEIFFKETKDGPPIFGLFKGTPEAAKEAQRRYGNLKKTLSKLIVAKKKEGMDRRVSSRGQDDISEVALSILEYWYQEAALKCDDKFESQNHHFNYWTEMEKISESKKNFPNKNRCDFGKYYFNLDQIQQLSRLPEDKKKEINFFQLVKPTSVGIRVKIQNQVQKFMYRSRFDLCYEQEIIFQNLPVHLIPVSQPQVELNPSYTEVFIGFTGIEVGKKRKNRSLTFLLKRIKLIMDSLEAIHSIASKHLGPALSSTKEDLLDWFQMLLLGSPDDQLPLFGWVTISFPLEQAHEDLFSAPQKYLARSLMYAGRISGKIPKSISSQLFGFWYEHIAFQGQIYKKSDSTPKSYSDLLTFILEETEKEKSTKEVSIVKKGFPNHQDS
jgi:hypothetical protein